MWRLCFTFVFIVATFYHYMMKLNRLSILNFKNIEQAELEFSPKINCFIGNNGVGKTNVLDAIYYLSFCKSYFNTPDSSTLKHNEEMMLVKGVYDRLQSEEVIYCGLRSRQKKQFKRNEKEYPKLSEHIGLLPLVMVSPADTQLVTEGSEERRKYMNGVISQFDPQYLATVIHYNRILSQRNALLKSIKGRSYDPELFEVFNEQLSLYAKEIFEKRTRFIEELLPIFNELYAFISGDKEEISLSYKSDLQNGDLDQQLLTSFEKDVVLGYTTKGIHKDDLIFMLNNFPIKREGSQGQRKTYLISLKLAQYSFIRKVNEFTPILLLDDVFDKLDANRVEQIVKLVSDEGFGQIFITDTNREHLSDILEKVQREYRIFNVSNGQLTQLVRNDEG